MSETPELQGNGNLPFRSGLEARHKAKVVTYVGSHGEEAGGQCNCCGSGPNPHPEWRDSPWYVYRAGICDADGIYMAMLCEGCLKEIRAECESRPHTIRDEMARIATELLGDDIDGACSMMDFFNSIEDSGDLLDDE